MTMQATETAPIQKSVIVPLPVEKAFRLFTDAIDTWWPFDTHSIGGEKVDTAILEKEEGGRLFERHADGTEHDWGLVTAWDPPNRLALDWRVSPNTYGTEVEVRFTPEGEDTRVELEHRGWEQCGPGSRESYDGGWSHVLGRFVEAALGARRRRAATSSWPSCSAIEGGVRPSSVAALGSAPCASRSRAISASPSWAAAWRALKLPVCRAFGSAPASSSMRTISGDFAAAALCNGVTFPKVGETACTSAPRSSRSRTASG